MPATVSSAPTNGISVVPGLAKQTSTPASRAVVSTTLAPLLASVSLPNCGMFMRLLDGFG